MQGCAGMRGQDAMRWAVRLAAAAAIGASLAAAPAARAVRPPPVPSCPTTSGIRVCTSPDVLGPFRNAPGMLIIRETSSDRGLFRLNAPGKLASVDTKTPLGCGDAACVYNHFEWGYGYTVAKGCRPNDVVCWVRVPPNSSGWWPLPVTFNDGLYATFLLFYPGCTPAHALGLPGGASLLRGPQSAMSATCPVERQIKGQAVYGSSGTTAYRPATGAPGVHVTVTGRSDKGAEVTRSATTGANGRYAVTVPPGSYTVRLPEHACVSGRTGCDRTQRVDTSGAGARVDIVALSTSEITGRVRTASGTGVADATVEASGPTRRRARTDARGRFRLEVPPGDYVVRPSKYDGGLVAAVRQRRFWPDGDEVEVKPGRNATTGDFQEYPVVTGVIAGHGNVTVSGADVRLSRIGGGLPANATTDRDGRYGAAVRDPGEYLVAPSLGGDSSPIVPVPGPTCAVAGTACRTRVNDDVKVNFKSRCETTVDFKTSMIATNGCFVRVARERWEATGSFRINGIDFATTDRREPMIFDGKAKTVSGRNLQVWISAPESETHWLNYRLASFSHAFPGTTVRYTLALVNPFTRSGAKRFLAASTLFGFPAHAPALELESTAGRTAAQLQLSGPPEDGAFVDPLTGLWKRNPANPRIAYPNVVRAALALTNAHGLQSVEGSFASKGIYGFMNGRPATTKFPVQGFVQIARLGIKYDLAFKVWRLSGVVVLHGKPGATATVPASDLRTPLVGPEGEVFLAAKIVEFEAGVSFAELKREGLSSFVQRVAIRANGLNWLWSPAWQLYVQRLSFDGGRDTDAPSAPYKVVLGAGLTWLPRFRNDFWFAEAASLDLDAGDYSDRGWVANGTLRVAGARIAWGSLVWSPAWDVDLNGTIALNPRDLVRSTLRTNISFLGTGRLAFPWGRPWSATASGTASAGRSQLKADLLWQNRLFALCMGRQSRWGLVVDVATHTQRLGGCDISDFGPPRHGRAAAAATGGLTLGAAALRGLAVRGAGGPPRIRVEGPGGIAAASAGGTDAVLGDRVSVIPNASDATTYVFITPAPAGAYRIIPQPGSPAIGSIAVAGPLPRPRVAARVTGTGCRRTLHWRLVPRSGQAVRFVVSDGRTEHPIATTAAARGSARFRPAASPSAWQAILAEITQDGAPRATLNVGRITGGRSALRCV